MEDAYPLEWAGTLTTLLADVRGPVVPGHGAVVDAAYVAAQRDELARLARWLTEPGAPPAFDERTREVARTRVPR